MPLDPISAEYISLAFAIERLVPGFVDGYVGPPDLKASADVAGPQTAAQLVARAQQLNAAVAASDYPVARKEYVATQVRGMGAVVRRLAGENIPYVDEVQQCFDIVPRATPETEIEESIAALSDLLPGSGSIEERLQTWRANYAVSTTDARKMINAILVEAQRRTAAFVDLPADDEIEVAFVNDKPWAGYNWYLGSNRSR